MAGNIDPIGAVGTAIGLIQIAVQLVNTEREKWDCYKDLPNTLEECLPELKECDDQLKDLKSSYDLVGDDCSEPLKRSYRRIITSELKKFEDINKDLKSLQTIIPKPDKSRTRKYLRSKRNDRKVVSFAKEITRKISEHAGDLKKMVRDCHTLMESLEEKRGDQFTPFFFEPNFENVILNMDDESTPEGKLKKAVMACGDVTAVHGSSPRNEGSSSTTDRTTSVAGLGGIGKTTALQGLALDKEVKETFKDGVLFMTFGKDADDKTWVNNFRTIVKQTGGEKLSETLDGELKYVIRMTKEWFKDKKVLFICDDLWPTPSNTIACLYELKDLRQCSSTCQVVLSTRYREIALKACRKSEKVVKFTTLNATDARALDVLLKNADISVEEYESLSEDVTRLVRGILLKCGGLYLALAVAGGILWMRNDDDNKNTLSQALQKLYSALSEKEEDLLDGSVEEHNTTLYCCFEESLERINEWAKGQGLGDFWYITIPRLCVYQKNTKLTKEMMKCVWLEEYHVDKLLKKLRNFHLVEFEKDAELCTFHDLFHDFCIRKAGGEREVPRLHREFLDNVAERCGVLNLGQSSAERICGRSWWTLKDVGGIEMYMRSNVARHLKEAGKVDELEALMTRFEWTLLRFRKSEYNEMMNDLSIWVHEEVKKLKDANEGRNEYIKKRQMQRVISYAWSKSDNEKELACEILSHLLDSREVSEAVRSYIASVGNIGMKGWLRPLQQVREVPSADVINVQFSIKDISVNWMRNQAIVVGESQIALLNLSTLSVRVLFNNISRNVTCVVWSKSGNTVILGSQEGEIMKCNVDEESIQTICNVVGNLFRAVISEDGSRIAYVSSDTIHVWDVEKGEELCVLEGHSHCVGSVAISGDGSRVVSGSRDRTVRVWEVGNGKEFSVFKGHWGLLTIIAISGDGSRVVCVSLDRTVRVWDVEKGKEFCFEGHSNSVLSVAISRDGCRVVSGSEDETVRVWDAEKGSELCVFEGHDGRVRSVAISEDGSRVASGSWDTTVRVWKVEKQTKLRALVGHSNIVSRVAINREGSRVVSDSKHGTVRVGVVEKESGLCEFKGHEDRVRSVAISEDGSRVASGSLDTTVRVWKYEKQTKLPALVGHSNKVSSVAINREGSRVVSGSQHGTVRVGVVEKESGLCEFKGHEDRVRSVAISEDGSRVVSGSDDRTVRVWDVQSRKELCILEGHVGQVRSVAMSRDENRVVSGSWDQTVRIWDVQDGKEIFILKGHEKMVSSVAISRDGGRVVSGSYDRTVRVWDAEKGSELCVLKGHEGPVLSVAISEDGSRVASGSWDTKFRTRKLKKQTKRVVFDGEKDCGDSTAISGNLNRVVSASYSGTVRDGEKRSIVSKFEGYDGRVRSVAMNSNRSRNLYGSTDKTVRVWNVESREELCVLESHDSPLDKVAMSENGRFVAYRSREGQLLIWKAKDNAYGHKPNYVSFAKLCFRESCDFGFIGQRIVIGFGDGRILQYDMIE